MKQMKAIELLIEKIQRDYPNDVSLVILMGSAIYNDTHNRSDVDMFFVPKTEKGYKLTFTCIVDEIGYDFWAMPWERLNGIAAHEERLASVITEGRVLYSASDEDMERWNILKEKALDVSDRKRFVNMADEIIVKAGADIASLVASDNIRDVRFYSIVAISTFGQVLALINKTTIKRGRGKLRGEILAMPIKPQKFEVLYDMVFHSDNIDTIKDSMLQLYVEIRELISEEKVKVTPVSLFKDSWSQLYEELMNAYNKIAHACEIGDPETALFAAVELVDGIGFGSRFTGVDVNCLPDIITPYNAKDMSLFEETAKRHKIALEKLLDDNGVPVRRFADFAELEKYFESL